MCNENKTYGISYEIVCDPEMDVKDTPSFTFNQDLSTKCRPYYTTRHKSGCQIGDLNAIWRFVEANSMIFGIVLMVLGSYNLTLGRKFVRPTIGIIFCLTTVAIILFLFYVFLLSDDAEKWVGWLLLTISVILGGIVGFFASKLIRVGVFFIGVWSGAGIGLLLNNMIFYKINNVAVLWVLMAVFGITLGILSFFWYNYIVIICTSIFGSYLFVRGLSLMAGGYPNEFTIYERMNSHDIDSVPGTFYAYVAGMVVVCALGIFFQLWLKKKEDKKDEFDIYKRV